LKATRGEACLFGRQPGIFWNHLRSAPLVRWRKAGQDVAVVLIDEDEEQVQFSRASRIWATKH
jgi:hypothetical protein